MALRRSYSTRHTATGNLPKSMRRISIETFDDCDPTKPVLTSPRSLHACRVLGIDPNDLVAKPESDNDMAASRHMKQAKWAHMEAIRKEKIREVTKKRAELIKQENADESFDIAAGHLNSTQELARREEQKREALATQTLEMEQRRIDAMRKRAEREIDMLVARANMDAEAERKRLELEKRRKEKEKRKLRDLEEKHKKEVAHQNEMLVRLKERQEHEEATVLARRMREAEKTQKILEVKATEEEERLRAAQQKQHEMDAAAIRKQQALVEFCRKKEEAYKKKVKALAEKDKQLKANREAEKQALTKKIENARNKYELKRALIERSRVEKERQRRMLIADKESWAALRQEQIEKEKEARREEVAAAARERERQVEEAREKAILTEKRRYKKLKRQQQEEAVRVEKFEEERKTEVESTMNERAREAERRRQAAAERAELELRAREAYFAKKLEDADVRVHHMYHVREQDQIRRQEEARLAQITRQERLKRLRLQDEYKRAKTMEKLEMQNARRQLIEESKKKLAEDRRRLQEEAEAYRKDLENEFERKKRFELQQLTMNQLTSENFRQEEEPSDASMADMSRYGSMRPNTAPSAPLPPQQASSPRESGGRMGPRTLSFRRSRGASAGGGGGGANGNTPQKRGAIMLSRPPPVHVPAIDSVLNRIQTHYGIAVPQ